ncbi:MAG: IclR family transcriptional regulator [Oscillospiraceae bacterium]
MPKKPSNILSVGKAFTILTCLSQADTPLSLRELAEKMEYPKSTIYSMLSTMREYRAISQDDGGRYCLGPLLFELGSSVTRQWDITSISRPYLQSLSDATNESVCIAMLDGDFALVLDCVAAKSPMRVVTDAGTHLPLYASALGKALLAHMPAQQSNAYISQVSLIQLTPHTITDRRLLADELALITKNGCAIENGEQRIGMRAVGAPIFGFGGAVKYSIAVTGMLKRTTDETFVEAEKLVINAAAEISKKLM